MLVKSDSLILTSAFSCEDEELIKEESDIEDVEDDEGEGNEDMEEAEDVERISLSFPLYLGLL